MITLRYGRMFQDQLDGEHGLGRARLAELAPRFGAIRQEVQDRRAAGEYGFYKLVDQDATVRQIKAFAEGLGQAHDHVLVLGIGYKRNHEDARESPGLRLLEMLKAAGALADYFDPLVPEVSRLAEHPALAGRRGIVWSVEALRGFDAALIATDHDGVDYAALAAAVPLVVDTRGVCARLGLAGPGVVTA